jgi:hypothetical protein
MENRMNRYVCIHGHFYQPPRENPWLETVEMQDSALPYHDWNTRIAAECYEPNAASRRATAPIYTEPFSTRIAKAGRISQDTAQQSLRSIII